MRFEKVENMYLTEDEFRLLSNAMNLCYKIKTYCSHPDCQEEAHMAQYYLSLLSSRALQDTDNNDISIKDEEKEDTVADNNETEELLSEYDKGYRDGYRDARSCVRDNY